MHIIIFSEQQFNHMQALNDTNCTMGHYMKWGNKSFALLQDLWYLLNGQKVWAAAAGAKQLAWNVQWDRTVGKLILNIAPKQQIQCHLDYFEDFPYPVKAENSFCYLWWVLQLIFLAARIEQGMSRIKSFTPSPSVLPISMVDYYSTWWWFVLWAQNTIISPLLPPYSLISTRTRTRWHFRL